jgi:hypothetical protein
MVTAGHLDGYPDSHSAAITGRLAVMADSSARWRRPADDGDIQTPRSTVLIDSRDGNSRTPRSQ